MQSAVDSGRIRGYLPAQFATAVREVTMSPFPVADWQASLDEMETALTRTLAALDRCQEGWERACDATTTSAPVVGLELSLREWDARLLAAAELADSVERELNDKQDAVGRWQESIRLWQAK